MLALSRQEQIEEPLPRRAGTVRRFWNSFVGANGCSPVESNGELHLTAISD